VTKWTHELNKKFSKEDVQMGSKFMKKYTTFLGVKEMQIEIATRFHLTPIRMAIIKDNMHNKCW
jgi:hypothetical protein